MLKSAIVGCGGIAEVHATALHAMEDAALIAFADIKPERAEAFAARYGGSHWNSLERMLDEAKPDVVHICTPHYLHVPMALTVRAAGAHVFMEKPPAISRQELATLKAAFANSGEKLGICFQNRYNGAVKHMRELLAENRYGRVLGARAFVTWTRDEAYYTESGWRGSWATEGGGVLINQSIHTLDLLVYLLGEPLAVEANCANHHLKSVIQVEDTVEAYIDFGDQKALFYATTAYCADSPVMLELACEKGVIRMEGNQLREIPREGEVKETSFNQVFVGKEYWGSGHGICITDYYRCLQTGERFPIDCEAIKPTMELMLGIFESSLTRQTVTLR